MEVIVTGMGMVSALGNNVPENLHALITSKHGLKSCFFEELNRELIVGKVDLSNAELAQLAAIANPDNSRTALLGAVAAKECWGENVHNASIRTGLISGTSVGGMDVTVQFYQNKLKKRTADYTKLQYHDSGTSTEAIAKSLGFSGYVNTISTACSSGANAIMLGARLIKAGVLDRVLVGGTDALCQFTINGFNALMIYDSTLCKPFDEERNGLNLGEGAAFLLLENQKSRDISNNPALAKILGYANTTDAFHQTATSPNAAGAVMAMEQALNIAGLQREDIDFINAHGTGTKNNDLTESIAMQRVFNEKIPPFSSSKSFTGHTLAAAGAIEAIYAVLAIQNNYQFPNLRTQTPILETGMKPVLQLESQTKINTVLSNSFGFGGNCTSLILGR